MKRIASFEVNHDKLKPGMYTSRIDGDITTYDIRMVYPLSLIHIWFDETAGDKVRWLKNIKDKEFWEQLGGDDNAEVDT